MNTTTFDESITNHTTFFCKEELEQKKPSSHAKDKSMYADLEAYVNGRLESDRIEFLWQMMMVYPSLHRYFLTMVLLRYIARRLLFRRISRYPLRPSIPDDVS